MASVAEILDFWFGHSEDPSYGQERKVWFSKDPEFDQEVRSRFESTYDQAVAGTLDAWREFKDSCLALILLLDQFPRNMFRGKPQAFATDPQALKAAQHAVAQGFDRALLPVQRWFIYCPFEHSENLDHQQQAVQLFSQLADDPASQSPINYALQHQAIIQQFGRFPHRNVILGRASTPEELEFLKRPGSSF